VLFTLNYLLDLRADQGIQEFFTRFLFTENKWKSIVCLIDQAMEFVIKYPEIATIFPEIVIVFPTVIVLQ
jgi:hypothetical protein